MIDGKLSKYFRKFSWRGFAATLGLATALTIAPETGLAGPLPSSALTVSNSGTEHTRQMDALAARINRESPDVKIIMVSRDWFWLNMAQNNGNVSDARKAMLPLAERYVRDQTGADLPQRHYRDLVNLVMQEANNSLVVNLPDDKKGGPKKACFVLPPSPDAGSEYFLRRYTLNLFPGIHGSFAKAALQPGIRPEIHHKFNVYHELGHCLQKDSAAATAADAVLSPTQIIIWRHKKEAQAEAFGALLMARDDGITDFAGERADTRLSGVSTGGPVSYRSRAKFAYMGEMTNLHQHFGYIYTLHKPLHAAQEYIDGHRAGIADMNVTQLDAVSADLAEKTALGEDALMGALFLWETLYDKNNLKVLNDLRREVGPGNQGAHNFAFDLKDEMNEALKHVFVLPDNKNEDPIDHIPFDFTRIGAAQAELPGSNDMLAIMAAMKNKALIAGGVTPERLVSVYEQYKDNLRRDLVDRPASERPDIQNKLNTAYEALRLSLHEIRWEKEAREMERHAQEFAARQKTTPPDARP